MNFDYTPRTQALREQLLAFMAEHVYPAEAVHHEQLQAIRAKGLPWSEPAIVEELKHKARAAGLWNLFLPPSEDHPGGLKNSEYAPLCEIMGRVPFAPVIFNCSAPDTGNMETIARFGSPEHKRQWLGRLLDGEIRSAFLMTEPAVASSDATNIECRIERDGDHYVINGTKWWSSGAGHADCAVYIVMGKTDPMAAKHQQQTMLLVPSNTPGVRVKRALNVFGFDDAPHGHMEIELKNVRVPASAVMLGEGRGFEIAQGRLGPGRIHHCMRAIGIAERAMELMCERAASRVAFGKPLADQGVWQERIADSRCAIEQARLLTLKAAHMMDLTGYKGAQNEIAMIKVIAPEMVCKVVDWAIQLHGGAGVCQETPLAFLYARSRILRLVDGPDEVHRRAIARNELRKFKPAAEKVKHG